MKRKSIIFAITLLLVVGAALWGVNWRLNHPPLTKADKEFRALVAGADSVVIDQYDFRRPIAGQDGPVSSQLLSASQARELIAQIRLSEPLPNAHFTPKTSLHMSFQRGNENLVYLQVGQVDQVCEISTPQKLGLSTSSPRVFAFADATGHTVHQLNPRFNKRLNRTLDAYLPQRLRS